MKKRILVAFIVSAILLTFTACSDTEEYDVGSGTASRADISYPDPVSSGMQFESSLVISGDWVIVSKTQN